MIWDLSVTEHTIAVTCKCSPKKRAPVIKLKDKQRLWEAGGGHISPVQEMCGFPLALQNQSVNISRSVNESVRAGYEDEASAGRLSSHF